MDNCKLCPKCSIPKPIEDWSASEFAKNNGICKSCRKEYNQKYREENKETLREKRAASYEENKEEDKGKRKEYFKQYYQDNKIEIDEKSKIYNEEHKEEIKEHQKQWYEENKEEINADTRQKYKEDEAYREQKLETNKIYRENNKESELERGKEWRLENPEYSKEYHQENKEVLKIKKRKYVNDRYADDIHFRLRINVSNAIRLFLTNQGLSKNGQSITQALQYSLQELEGHLEKQFEPWMTWENWGRYDPENWNDNDDSTWTWQIDHIIPHSTFRYDTMDCEEFRACWALSNLRPYSAKQNIADKDRR